MCYLAELQTHHEAGRASWSAFFFVRRMKTKWDVKAFRGMVIASRLSQRCMQPCMATEVSILWACRTIVLRGTVNAAYWVIRAWCALLGRSWGVSYLAC